MEALRTVAGLNLICHVDVRKLGLAVRVARVVNPIEIKVVKVDLRIAMSGGGNIDDARVKRRRRAGEKSGLQQIEEQEMSKMVGAKLGLEPVGRSTLGGPHHASVVNEDVKFLGFGQELIGASANAVEGVHIQLDQLHASRFENVAQSRLSLLQVTGGAEESSARHGESACGLDANARGASGNEDDFVDQLAFEIVVLDDLERGGASVAGTLGGVVGGDVLCVDFGDELVASGCHDVR